MASSDTNQTMGAHIRRLRKDRRLTQDELGIRSDLATDTIRRLEGGGFSPSTETLRKLCNGLEIKLSTFFGGIESGEADEVAEFMDLLSSRGPADLALAAKVVRALFAGLDRKPSEGGALEEKPIW